MLKKYEKMKEEYTIISNIHSMTMKPMGLNQMCQI